jgi:activator of HSP90 ATPase
MTTSTLKTGEATAGSVWNKNSWHWEEKDYNKSSIALIRDALETLQITAPNGENIRFTSIEPKGFASISVRKGKKVVVFEFSISMNFESPSSKGTVKIPEFSNDELDPAVRVELGSGSESIKEFIRKEGSKAIKSSLARYVEFINSVETGDSLLAEDKERREKELEAAKRAEEEKGEEKKRIAESVKAVERESIANKQLAEASVWNVNSYHWETRNLKKWAYDWIIKNLVSGESKFSHITVSGEAENSIRKGKKISIYNLSISGQYDGTPFSIPSFTNEEGDDEMPKIVPKSSQIESEFRNRVLKSFLAEMKQQ